MNLTETWLHGGILDSAIKLAERDAHRANRSADDSGKGRGRGLGIYCTSTTFGVRTWLLLEVIAQPA